VTVEIKTELFCLHCGEERVHTLTYLGKYLHQIKCEECGIQLQIDRLKIMESYAEDLLEEILAKPHQLLEEKKRLGLIRFLKSLPVRVVTKPYRVAREAIEIVKKKQQRPGK